MSVISGSDFIDVRNNNSLALLSTFRNATFVLHLNILLIEDDKHNFYFYNIMVLFLSYHYAVQKFDTNGIFIKKMDMLFLFSIILIIYKIIYLEAF